MASRGEQLWRRSEPTGGSVSRQRAGTLNRPPSRGGSRASSANATADGVGGVWGSGAGFGAAFFKASVQLFTCTSQNIN